MGVLSICHFSLLKNNADKPYQKLLENKSYETSFSRACLKYKNCFETFLLIKHIFRLSIWVSTFLLIFPCITCTVKKKKKVHVPLRVMCVFGKQQGFLPYSSVMSSVQLKRCISQSLSEVCSILGQCSRPLVQRIVQDNSHSITPTDKFRYV